MLFASDFSDELKNLTLAEEPSSMYQKDKSDSSWMDRYQQESSSELEEVDSDSGYSSPLHRRNQASNGTHPLLGMTLPQPPLVPAFIPPRFSVPYVYPPMPIEPLRPAFIPRLPIEQMQPAFMPPMPYPLPVHANMQLNTVVPRPYAKVDPAKLPVQYTPNTTVASSSAGVDSTSKTASDEDSSKKKRRRRRKKKEEEDDDAGALSDDPFTLHRTHSSSNVSRTSTLDNDILHFEDEDEFPNLLNAANGLVNNMPNSSSANLSYSDILKSQVVSR